MTPSSTEAAALEGEIGSLEETKKLHTAQDPGEFKDKAGSHVPKIRVKEGKLEVEVAHEMKDEHFIEYIWAKNSEDGSMLGACKLSPSDQPILHVDVPDGVKSVVAFEMCNQHGLWKSDPTPVC
ncbi:hypothetical protein KFE25_006841 [Diacronema lutheri]|uniref:Desulfoferrodoxin ferrous iron-binding domain-containing protein n=1 Tax=Diacronema lutheri TaxID=2081491 RepID=A0A8J5XPQ2_DIALT|nr:hypothetical protein KFE25_006841 [Diacronema lutheri]